ncbi:MAG: hypothetical protein ACRD2L_14780 [Terriglobia bacterium]
MSTRVGILAYGSLIDDPGEEIDAAKTETIKDGVTTPFRVEFARTSKERAGAPTLVPVNRDGAQVRAEILILNVPEEEAANRLYRREINMVGMREVVYHHRKNSGPNNVVVERIENCHGVSVVLYTKIGANIVNPTPQKLAALAVESARRLDNGRDGITYLINAQRNGIATPLSAEYEEEIKRLTGSRSLAEALENVHFGYSA